MADAATTSIVTHEPSRESIEEVSKAIQSAAWRMNLTAFCAALEWEDDSYAAEKFSEFQTLARALARFDAATLTKLAQR